MSVGLAKVRAAVLPQEGETLPPNGWEIASVRSGGHNAEYTGPLIRLTALPALPARVRRLAVAMGVSHGLVLPTFCPHWKATLLAICDRQSMSRACRLGISTPQVRAVSCRSVAVKRPPGRLELLPSRAELTLQALSTAA